MASDLNDDAFREELLDLFTIEAQEWLEQAQAAFQEIQRHPGSSPNPNLLSSIQQAMTNLGGSAATVELPAVEQLAYAILPVVDAIREQDTSPSADQCAAINESLEQIGNAINLLSGSNLQSAAGQPTAGNGAATKPAATASTLEKSLSIEELRRLQKDLAQTAQTTRNLIGVVIEKAGRENGSDGVHLKGSAITRILRELEGLDEQFLTTIQLGLPDILDTISRLKTAKDAPPPDLPLASVITSVQSLQEAAELVQATDVVQFLRGLHSFLTIITNRGTTLVTGRMEAVEFRLGAVVPMVHQWVEMGRVERAAIGRVLSS